MNRERRIANYLLVLYGSLSIVALSLPLSAPVLGLKTCVSYLLHPAPFYGARTVERAAGVPAGMLRLLRADAENRRLLEEFRRLMLLEAEVQSLRRENERLRAELGFKPPAGRAVCWAQVMERDPLNWYRHLMVDAGRKDGVEVHSPVLGLAGDRFGVVGRVVEAGSGWSKVLLLTDEMSSVAAYLPARGWEGLIEGQGGSRLRMNYLDPEARLAIGDAVHTSFTSATFPPDILVGRITNIFQRDPFLTFQSVEVTPALSASALKEVLILAPFKGSEDGASQPIIKENGVFQ